VDPETGLSQAKASLRLQQDGPNSLVETSTGGIWRILLNQFKNLFILLILGAATISYFVDGVAQSLILLAIVLLNVIFGFFQEYKAERTLQDLKSNFTSRARVLRGGKVIEIESALLVRGDIVLIEAGGKVPADLRIIEAQSLEVNESALTGESLPVSKNAKTLSKKKALPDQINMLFNGDIIVSGHSRGIVVATGAETEFGKIASLTLEEKEKTPLEKQIIYLAKKLTLLAVAACVVIFALGLFRQIEVLELLTFTIALLVAVVPESLPTAITLALAIGVSRMAKKKALVKKMSAVETLGSVSIIATDKTGTLTNNDLEVGEICLYDRGKFEQISTKKNIDRIRESEAGHFIVHGLACSNLNLEGNSDFLGDSVEVAIANLAKTHSHLDRYFAKNYERIFEIPFDSEKKYMGVIVNSAGKKSLIAKGTTEKIVEFCVLKQSEKEKILEEAHKLSAFGYKVIALADKHLSSLKSSALAGMTFKGFFALADEPSEGVKEAIALAIKAGIRPVILTGDHPETARFIAEKVGISIEDDEIIIGEMLEKKSDRELLEIIKKVKIFARIAPADKIRIVELFQRQGYCVAMTGDGINDAPALKKADVGIAMGQKGTDIAKDSADIVLLDDKYATILSAVEYGRTIYDNIKNIVVFLVSGNLVELFLVGVGFGFNLPLPITTIQILWINLITDSLPALALCFEKPEKEVLSQPPRSSKKNALKISMTYGLSLAVLSFTIGLGLYLYAIENFSPIHARTVLFTYLVFMNLAFVVSIRSKKRIWQSPAAFFRNPYLWLSVLVVGLLQVVIFLPSLRHVFGIVALNSRDITILLTLVIISFLGAEIIRAVHDKRAARLTK
jgi:Ca2+-transporting ATPase